MSTLVWDRWVVVTAVVIAVGACRPAADQPPETGRRDESRYDVAKDPQVNPPTLLTSAPDDRHLIATDEWLYACLKGNPNTLNPILMSSVPERRLESVLYDYPFVHDWKLEWRTNESMVKSYEESADHLTSTLRLKKGLGWHDGHPFTAHDIAFSWQQILDERVPVRAARSGTDSIVDCVALDDWTVKFVYKAALPTSKWNIMFAVIPQHIYQKDKTADPTLVTSDYHNRFNRNPIGNGPYKFVEWVTDDKIVLERWEQYPGPRPHFAGITFQIIPDASSRLLAFERQEVDEVELTPQQFALETTGENFRKVGVKGYSPRWTFYYLGWNQDGSNPFFDDRLVRRAMCYATDYDLIVKQAFVGLFSQSYGIFHPTCPAFNTDIARFEHDLARASGLLDQAGWIKDPQDGWRYKDVQTHGAVTHTKFSFTLDMPKSQTGPKVAAILREDLQKIGVEMKTRVLEWAAFLERIRNHEFEAHYSAFLSGLDPDEGWNLWRTEAYENGRNYGGYSNPRVDELFELGRRTFNVAKRMRYYAELSKTVYEACGDCAVG